MIASIIFALVIQFSTYAQKEIKLSKKWEIDSVFMTPESAVYDSIRNCLYVSNFNDKGGFRRNSDTLFDECISKVDLNGKVIDFRWVNNLLGPTGITIFNDKLYVLERGYLTLIDIERHAIEKRIPIKNSGFLNDIVIDKNGDIYISDSQKSSILKFENNECKVWWQDTTLCVGSNGLYIYDNKLIVGNQKNNLISVSIPGKEIKVIASNILEGIDGLNRFKDNFIVSWRSKIALVDDKGFSNVLLDTKNNKEFLADFEFIKKKRMIVVPTLTTNKLVTYEIVDEK